MFAAFTMASTSSLVMSPWTIWILPSGFFIDRCINNDEARIHE